MRDDIQEHNGAIEDRHWWFAARRRILRDLVDELAGGRRLRIVDIGCSTGGNAGSLAGAHDVVGFDASDAAIRIAQTKYPKARFAVATDFEPIRTAIRTADLVLLMDEATFDANLRLAVPHESSEEPPDGLNPGEQRTLERLRTTRLRLEQERIPFAMVIEALRLATAVRG